MIMDSFSEQAIAAKESDEKFHKFTLTSQPFIQKCACSVCKHFVSDADDEWSISLIAFSEAVRSYDESKGNFYAFAKMVIKRRLMDYFDGQSRFQAEIVTSPESFSGDLDYDMASPYEISVVQAASDLSRDNTVSSPLVDEVEALEQILAEYGFPLFDVGGCSPKLGRTKKGCAAAITTVLERPELLEKLRRTKSLPYTELMKTEHVTKKILERHRKYLIAAIEILAGDFPQLGEYVSAIKKYL